MAVGTTSIFHKKTLYDAPLDGKTVLVRVDYNVPLESSGEIADDLRIRASLDTIHELKRRNCKIILCAHLGRPEGKKDQTYTLEPVAHRLVELLKEPVKFVDDCVGDKVLQASKRLRPKEVLLLENLRFHPGEEENSMAFATQLKESTRAQYFVQDGFGIVHRAHASTDAITQLLPGVAGCLLIHEVTSIVSAMNHSAHPFVAVLGGAKVSDKTAVIEKLIDKADTIIVGGAMANTFLKHRGIDVGKSKVEASMGPVIDAIYEKARQKTDNVDDLIILPTDVAVATAIDAGQDRRNVAVGDIKPDDIALDIGAETIERVAGLIAKARTVIWNGTLGITEYTQFAHGSARVALEIARNDETIMSIVGGGDTADFVLEWSGGEGHGFDNISTGGGASIELMAGNALPGVEALLDA